MMNYNLISDSEFYQLALPSAHFGTDVDISAYDLELEDEEDGQKSVCVLLRIGSEYDLEKYKTAFSKYKNWISKLINAIAAHKKSIKQFMPQVYIRFYVKENAKYEKEFTVGEFISGKEAYKTHAKDGLITIYDSDFIKCISNRNQIDYDDIRPFIDSGPSGGLINTDEHYDFSWSLAKDILSKQYHGEQSYLAEQKAKELAEAIQKALPEFFDQKAALALKELREQAHPEAPMPGPSYEGRRSGVDPIEFLKTHYEDQIRSGNFTPGDLQAIDAKLYASVRDRLLGQDNPMNITEFFETIKPDHKKGTVIERKIAACALLLDLSPEQAIHFFSNMRPDRLRTIVKQGPSSSHVR